MYRYFGFDHSYWVEDFEGAERLYLWITDQESYGKIEEIYEAREDGERIFVFNLTIQNHGGYPEEGVEHTGDLQLELVSSPGFAAGDYTTAFFDRFGAR